MLVRKPIPGPGLFQHRAEKRTNGAVIQESIPVLGEDRGHPHGDIHIQAHEPAEQQIVVQSLHHLAFRANAVEHLQRYRLLLHLVHQYHVLVYHFQKSWFSVRGFTF